MGASEPSAALVRQILAVCRGHVGSWPAVADVAAQGTGRAHSGRSASRWGNGHDMPGADVIVAVLRSLSPEEREALLDGSYEVAELEPDARLEALEAKVAQLLRDVALLAALLRMVNARAGLGIFENLPELNKANLDPRMVELLQQLARLSA